MSSTLSDNLPTPGFFTTAIQADENLNPFENSFKHGNTVLERSKPNVDVESETSDWPRPAYDDHVLPTSVAQEEYETLFGFSPRRQRSPSPKRETGRQLRQASQADLTNGISAPSPLIWNVGKSEERFGFGPQPMINTQEPSPPNSSDNSPVEWTFENFQPLLSPLHSMLTDTRPNDFCTRYGQVTPPIDLPNGLVTVDGTFKYDQSITPQSDFQTQSTGSAVDQVDSNLKRKRVAHPQSSVGGGNNASATKRQRKSNNRSKPIETAQAQEDKKRSKFLERNRVAASKCRQKKKEWTSNLESKARDLQNSKNQLALMVSSLKDEMLFLKGELLKHSNCNCSRIRDYLDQEVTSLAHPTMTQCPRLESPATRRCGSESSETPNIGDDLADRSTISPEPRAATSSESWDDESGSSDVPNGVQHHTDADIHALLSAQLSRPTATETKDQLTQAVGS
ncbi:MAG: hypothetical protein M1812_005455 [Candelaria pacifica]|nr:MAG: hypothetical protein M1812_005455 [Candelaria pacifica]